MVSRDAGRVAKMRMVMIRDRAWVDADIEKISESIASFVQLHLESCHFGANHRSQLVFMHHHRPPIAVKDQHLSETPPCFTYSHASIDCACFLQGTRFYNPHVSGFRSENPVDIAALYIYSKR